MTQENQEPQEEKRYRPKIARMDAKGKVLDVRDFILLEVDSKDNLEEGKIVLNYTEYDVNSHKAVQQFKHYIDVDVARVVFSDILGFRFRKDPKSEGYFIPLLDEYKGGRGSAAGHPEWEYASRRLIVNYNDQLRIGPSVVFNFMLGEGECSPTGAIMPKSRDAQYKGQIMVSLAKARAVAATVLDYINCLQTASMVVGLLDRRAEERSAAA